MHHHRNEEAYHSNKHFPVVIHLLRFYVLRPDLSMLSNGYTRYQYPACYVLAACLRFVTDEADATQAGGYRSTLID